MGDFTDNGPVGDRPTTLPMAGESRAAPASSPVEQVKVLILSRPADGPSLE